MKLMFTLYAAALLSTSAALAQTPPFEKECRLALPMALVMQPVALMYGCK